MFFGPQFVGDNNKTILEVQFQEYWNMLHNLLKTSAKQYAFHYMHAFDRPDYAMKLVDIEFFDHRPLQAGHDLIAGSFRYLFCQREDLNAYPPDFDVNQYYLESWRLYYTMENLNLSKIHKIAINIMESVAFKNTDRGYAAELELYRGLLLRYPYLTDVYREQN